MTVQLEIIRSARARTCRGDGAPVPSHRWLEHKRPLDLTDALEVL